MRGDQRAREWNFTAIGRVKADRDEYPEDVPWRQSTFVPSVAFRKPCRQRIERDRCPAHRAIEALIAQHGLMTLDRGTAAGTAPLPFQAANFEQIREIRAEADTDPQI